MAGLGPLLIDKLKPHHRILTAAAYIACVGFISIFPSFDRRTEIEEHALIPGYATSGLGGEWSRRLQSATRNIEASEGIHQALEKAFVDAALISHRANFTTSTGAASSFYYTAVPSSRGDSREACVVVIATNWTNDKKALTKASMGLGIGVTLAAYLKTVRWLSKDVFIVFVDSALPYGAGARAWLSDYFGGHSAVRRGVLRQAAVLDTSNAPTSMLLEAEGINGMVPNQDIVNAFMLSANERGSLSVSHRDVWASVFHHIKNGGVHSSHAPFLELQVPAFTVRGRRTVGARNRGAAPVNPAAIVQALEGVVRCMSNNLQQLHHSFNFYFFTSDRQHISSGLYLYPVFGMQLPLLSFLMTTPAYRDIKSWLIGLGVIAGTIAFSGSPIFLLATDDWFSREASRLFPFAAVGPPPVCEYPSAQKALDRRAIAASWIISGSCSALVLATVLRQYAFRVFNEKECGEGSEQSGQGARLFVPLWEAIRAASGFAFLVGLAPLGIMSWALAVPLTMVCVPALVLARPASLRHRPLRSLLLCAFLGGNLFLLIVHPSTRAQVTTGKVANFGEQVHAAYFKSLMPALPPNARNYMPTKFVDWLYQGGLATAFSGDFLIGLYESARDFNCVGGMLFPVFCFVYWPFLVLLAIVGLVLPAQRVEDANVSLQELKVFFVILISIVAAGFVGAVVWRSYTSSGLGALQWS